MVSNAVTQTESKIETTTLARRSELDLMEGLVVAGLVFFHTAMIFGTVPFYVKNDTLSAAVDGLIYFIALWAMPLLFLSSGSAIWYSLRKRTTWEFVGNRFRRLFVPFIVGLLVVFPPIIYFMLKFDDPTFQAPYGEFYLNFLKFILKWPLFFIRAPFAEGERSGHLWYLIHLLIFSFLLLPIFQYFRKPAGKQVKERFAGFCVRPGIIILLALPIAIIEAALGTEDTGMWNRYVYIFFLLYGFLFVANAQYAGALRRHWKIALILGLLMCFTIGIGGLIALSGAGINPLRGYDLWSFLWRFFKGISGWFMVIAILGLAASASQTQVLRNQDALKTDHDKGLQSLSHNPSLRDRVAQYAGEAQLPFYVLHMTPIVLIGYYVVQWEINALVKYIVICLASFAVTLVVYDIGVRRTRVTRFLFGMNPKKKE